MKIILKSFSILFVLFVGFCLFILSNQIGGWRSFIVKSGSMEPTITTGSLVITQRTQPNTLKKGDIITFIRPTKERDFITHRIVSSTNKDNLTTIKTKGDNNKTQDSWLLAGGGVVGKVVYTFPYLGFFMSFAQSKIGIVLFVLIPAIYIIVEEISSIINLLKKSKKQNTAIAEPVALFAVILFGIYTFSIPPTHALLSDTASLVNNTFTVSLNATSHCGGTTININGNGTGTNNSVNVISNCLTDINQTNHSSVNNSININTVTGSTNASGSTDRVTTWNEDNASSVSVLTTIETHIYESK